MCFDFLKRKKFSLCLCLFQTVFLVLFGIFVQYDEGVGTSYKSAEEKAALNQKIGKYYSMFQDVHVIVFIGIGYLMTFMKRYCYMSVGMCFVLGVFVIQWSTLMGGFLHLEDGYINVSIIKMLTADFAAAVVLISFGAAQGKMSPIQLLVAAFFEIIFFNVNEWIGLSYFQVNDVGGSIFVHVFAAYFGIAMCRVLYREDLEEVDPTLKGPVYHSDVFSMVGTIFLWMFWPSFNSALALAGDQHRAVVNTYFAMVGSCLAAFMMSPLLNPEDKFCMDHLQNATLAGGVAIGNCADMMVQPWGALLIGCLAGTVSVCGFRYISSFLERKFKLHDTCGIHNLHGIPGVMAALIGAVVVSLANEETYKSSLYHMFPARAPLANTTEYIDLMDKNLVSGPGLNRTAGEQACWQLAALALTLAMSIVGGVITGFILKIPIWDQPTGDMLFDDEDYYEIPEYGFPGGLRAERITKGRGPRFSVAAAFENKTWQKSLDVDNGMNGMNGVNGDTHEVSKI